MIYLFILLLILGVVLAIAIRLRQRSQQKPISERESCQASPLFSLLQGPNRM